MIQNSMAKTAARWLLAGVFACGMFASNIRAQDAPAAAIYGVYNGSYTDAQGTTKFKLSLTENANGRLAGVFTFYLPGGDTNAYTRDLLGQYIPRNRLFALRAGKWETVPPRQVVMMGMNGMFDPDGGQGAGKISGRMLVRPGAPFEAIRDAAESANLAGMIAARKAVEPPVASAAPASQPTAAAVQTPPSAQASLLQLAPPTAINGVYNGTYSCVNGSVNLKLSLKSTDNGVVTGFFTFDLPPDAGGARATYKLTGRYAWGVHQFVLTAQAVGTPAPSGYSMTRVSGSYVAGSDWIEGQVAGPSFNSFHATRDKAESANLDVIMAAQAGAGAQQLVLAQPPKAPGASPNPNPGAKSKRHGAPVTASSPAGASPAQTVAAAPAEPRIPVTSVKDYLALASGQQTKLFDAIVHELAARTKDAPRVLKRFTGDPNDGLMDFNDDIASLKKQAALGQVDLAQTNVQSLVQGTIDFYVHTDIQEDMENPKDTKWVDELDLDRPAIIKALFTGDFSHVVQLRGQVLTYIAALNDNLFSINCTNLYDSTISDAATAGASGGTASSFMSGLGNGGNMSALRMNLERQQMDTDSGASDAETLYFNGPQDCDNTLWEKIIQNMRTYVQSQ
jgi:hypothetical protein